MSKKIKKENKLIKILKTLVYYFLIVPIAFVVALFLILLFKEIITAYI